MAKSEKRVKITLECQVCKRRNYITMKNKINDRERLEMKKYCKFDRKHTAHKETSVAPARLPARREPAGSVDLPYPLTEGSSSAGRAPVSKTGGRGFESLLPCSARNPDGATDVTQSAR